MKKQLTALLCTSLLCFSACTDDNNDSSNTKSYDKAEDVYTEAGLILAEGFCKQVFECPEVAGYYSVLALGRYANKADCIKGVGSFEQPENIAAVNAGRIKYNKANAAVCIATVRKSFIEDACKVNQRNDEPPECEQIFTGTVADGGKCNGSDECSGDLRCDKSNQDTCYGTCKPNTRECGDAQCDNNTQYCDNSAMPPKCEPLKKAGEMCDFNAGCEKGYDCISDENFMNGTCVAEYSVAEGGRCNYDANCKEGLECDNDADKCVKPSNSLKLIEKDAECDIQDETAACKPGTTCQDLNLMTGKGKCGTPVAKGGDCLQTFACAPNLFCKDANPAMMVKGKCSDLLADGETCQFSSDCKSGDCDDQTNKCVTEMACTF